MARWDRRREEGWSSVPSWRETRVPALQEECALRLKEVRLLALSGQQGRGNFPRTRWPSQPVTWETRAVGVALRLVTEKSGSDPWPSPISGDWVELYPPFFPASPTFVHSASLALSRYFMSP